MAVTALQRQQKVIELLYGYGFIEKQWSFMSNVTLSLLNRGGHQVLRAQPVHNEGHQGSVVVRYMASMTSELQCN